jgi:transcriptional repressor NrdR
MNCPFCAEHDNQVLESRSVEEGKALRRRRECNKCGKRFTTYEKVNQRFLWVVKKDGAREPFDKEKIKRGILRAVEKRPISLDLVNDIVDQVEMEVLKSEREEVPTRFIGKEVMKRLKKVDKVAWLRFASVYLEFEGLDDFKGVIR